MTDFNSGDQVAVKAEGFPFWPAIVTDPASLGLDDPGAEFYCLQYYGTGDAGFAPKDPATIIKFDADFEEWKGTTDEALQDAIKQAVDAAAGVAAAGGAAEDAGGDSGDEDDVPAAAGAEETPEERERRKREKKERKKAKEKKRREKEERKKAKDDEERRKKKEAKRAERSHDKKKKKHHDYDDEDGRMYHTVAATERLQKQKVKPTLDNSELQKLSDDLEVAVDMMDEAAARGVLSELCKVNVTMPQLKDTKLGPRLSGVLDSSLYAAKPIVLILIRSWVHAAPEKQRKALMVLGSTPEAVALEGENNLRPE